MTLPKLTVVICIFLIAFSATADPITNSACVHYENSTHWSSRIHTRGGSWAVEIVGDYAFVATGTGSPHDGGFAMLIFDLSDPDDWVQVGTMETPGFAQGICVADELAFIADSSGGLQVVDVSDVTSPVIVGAVDTEDARNVWVSGSIVYVSDALAGVKLVDVSDPTAPTILGTVGGIGLVHEVQVVGSTAFVASIGGFFILDVSQPEAPVIKGRYRFDRGIETLLVSGDLVYVSGPGTPLTVISIDDPKYPRVITGPGENGSGRDMVLFGDRLCVVIRNADYPRVEIFDVTDAQRPEYLQTVSLSAEAWSAATTNTGIVVASRAGLETVVVSAPAPVTGSLAESSGSLAVANGFAYLGGSRGLKVIDINDAGHPELIAFVPLPHDPKKVALMGNLALVADGYSGLVVIDITDPKSPAIIGSVATHHYAVDVAAQSGYAYVADDRAGLQIVDLSTPSTPVIVGTTTDAGYIRGLTVSGNTAYLTSSAGGLAMYDITDPTTPQRIGSLDLGNNFFVDAVVSDGLAYVVADVGRLQVIDVADPSAPWLVSSCDLPGETRSLAVAGDHVYVAGYRSGLHVVDLEYPANPRVVGAVNIYGDPADVVVSENHLVIAGLRELVVAPRHCGGEAPVPVTGISVRPGRGTATVAWTLGLMGFPGEFWVTAERDGAQWDVPYLPVGPRNFEARDESFHLADGGQVLYSLFHRNADTEWSLLGTASVFVEIPGITTVISNAWPNPFNPELTISFTIKQSGPARMVAYDLAARKVAVLTDQIYTGGTHEVQWDGNDMWGRPLPSGIYAVRLEASEDVASKLVTLVR